MNDVGGLATMATRTNIARLFLAIAGLMAMTWAFAVFPVFWSQNVVVDVGAAVIAGEAFKPDVLTAVVALTETNGKSMVRPSVLDKVTAIRVRQAEDAIRAGDPRVADQRLESLNRSVNEAARNAPNDPFLWLIWFWLDSTRNGLRSENLAFLRMSYDLGPYEGWIAAKRNGLALAAFAALPNDLAERAIAEFVGLVRWGLVADASAIAARTPPQLRSLLFARLKDVDYEQRRAFAGALYGREVDDVPVPGIAPPTPPVRMPVMPPDF